MVSRMVALTASNNNHGYSKSAPHKGGGGDDLGSASDRNGQQSNGLNSNFVHDESADGREREQKFARDPDDAPREGQSQTEIDHCSGSGGGGGGGGGGSGGGSGSGEILEHNGRRHEHLGTGQIQAPALPQTQALAIDDDGYGNRSQVQGKTPRLVSPFLRPQAVVHYGFAASPTAMPSQRPLPGQPQLLPQPPSCSLLSPSPTTAAAGTLAAQAEASTTTTAHSDHPTYAIAATAPTGVALPPVANAGHAVSSAQTPSMIFHPLQTTTQAQRRNDEGKRHPNLIPSSDINRHDVLCGRGAGTNRHVGNQTFRSFVSNYQAVYAHAPVVRKSEIAQGIVDAIRSMDPPGRFLKRATKGYGLRPGSEEGGTLQGAGQDEMWYEIGDKAARDKTSQALREKGPEIKIAAAEMAAVAAASSEPGTPHATPTESSSSGVAIPASSAQTSSTVGTPSATAGGQPVVISGQASPAERRRSSSGQTYTLPPQGRQGQLDQGQQEKEGAYQGHQDSFYPHHPPPNPLSSAQYPTEHFLQQPHQLQAIAPAPDPFTTNTQSSKIDINPHDVLMGRGGVTNSHSGNVAYRSLVRSRQPRYLAAAKMSKSAIAQEIVDEVHRRGGRFLQFEEDEEDSQTMTTNKCAVGMGGTWIEVPEKRAQEKTSQALRERAPEMRRVYSAARSLLAGANSTTAAATGGAAKKIQVKDDSGAQEGSVQTNNTSQEQVPTATAAAATPSLPRMHPLQPPAPLLLSRMLDQGSPPPQAPSCTVASQEASRAAPRETLAVDDSQAVPPHPKQPLQQQPPQQQPPQQPLPAPQARPHESSPQKAPSPSVPPKTTASSVLPAYDPLLLAPAAIVTAVHPHDVLYGRGAGISSHPGNVRFRSLVRLNRPRYLESTKSEKTLMAKGIVAAIRDLDPPGRFLVPIGDDSGGTSGSAAAVAAGAGREGGGGAAAGMWIDVGDDRARDKASQALRERSRSASTSSLGGVGAVGEGAAAAVGDCGSALQPPPPLPGAETVPGSVWRLPPPPPPYQPVVQHAQQQGHVAWSEQGQHHQSTEATGHDQHPRSQPQEPQQGYWQGQELVNGSWPGEGQERTKQEKQQHGECQQHAAWEKHGTQGHSRGHCDHGHGHAHEQQRLVQQASSQQQQEQQQQHEREQVTCPQAPVPPPTTHGQEQEWQEPEYGERGEELRGEQKAPRMAAQAQPRNGADGEVQPHKKAKTEGQMASAS